MSHIVSIKTQLKDPKAIAAACAEMGLAEPVHGTAKVFMQEKTGLLVKFPKWNFPIVIDTATGAVEYDNYNGKWGAQSELDRFTQLYGVHKATMQAKAKGYFVKRDVGQDGTIRLEVTGM